MPNELTSSGIAEGIALISLSTLPALYAFGLVRLWRHAGLGRGVAPRHAACFAAGWTLLIIALYSPLHALAERYFYAHMVEHELLMAAAAPLLVLSRPLAAFGWSVPNVPRGWMRLHRPLARLWKILTKPTVATVLHGAAIWIWHAPALFMAANANEALHWLQHASFLATGLLFWSAMFAALPGAALGHLFATSMHTSLLGALLVLATRPWLTDTGGGSLPALADQQIGGLIMWVPGCMVYTVAALAMAGRWIMKSEERRLSGSATLPDEVQA